ncbi:hypothetical protein [Dactylosporangium sp. CA-233914]|uniref:hypothetical protein n=1 Tax=Dactylosporangium sp. CA-233914 TaxID=3239934 RepID=UPI003D8E442E
MGRDSAALLRSTVFGVSALVFSLLVIAGRARPDVENMGGPMPTSSGHVAATIRIWATAAVLVWPRTRAWWRRC